MCSFETYISNNNNKKKELLFYLFNLWFRTGKRIEKCVINFYGIRDVATLCKQNLQICNCLHFSTFTH